MTGSRGRADDTAPSAEVRATLDEAEEQQLAAAFVAPPWLGDLGRTSWLLVGVAALLAIVTWVLGQAAVIVQPVLVALIIATVAAPVVARLERHMPRTVGALIVLLALVALGVVIILLVVGGLIAQGDAVREAASSAADKAEAWLKDVGVDDSGAASAKESVSSAVPGALHTLTEGVVAGIRGITSLAFGCALAAFAMFFLLRDGPKLRHWIDGRLRVPQPAAHMITGDVSHSMRRYFTGVTIVAGFNAIVVGIGAVVLGVPLAGTIAVVTFVTAYIPFIGAFVSGAFAVVMALGADGTSTALIMLVIVLLANGTLQNIVQPIAFGATLDLNPLLVLVVTLAAGSLFGMLGLVLAAPLTSAFVHIARDLARMRPGALAEPVTDANAPPAEAPLAPA